MRPNQLTRELLLKHRNDPTMQFDMEKEICVSVYIRRGDKHLEMKMIEDETVFFEGAKMLWNNLKLNDSSTNITHQKDGIMFIGSEDPNVIQSAHVWGKANHWKILYSNLFDRRQVSTHLNASEQQRARDLNLLKHHELEYFSMILNIDAHLRCSAFVCTHRSNFCRIIDELRATVGHKANKQYADFSCNGSPCIDSSLTEIDW
jgi:hypothetical protein